MKTYNLIFEDRQGNELQTKVIEANNLIEAKQSANTILATTKINDLYRIRVKRI